MEDELKEYRDCIVKISINVNLNVPYANGNFITHLDYNEKDNTYYLSHPYDLKQKYIIAGISAFDPNDVDSIEFASEEEALLWYREYVKFHKEVLKEKGYDSCEIEKFNEMPLNKK